MFTAMGETETYRWDAPNISSENWDGVAFDGDGVIVLMKDGTHPKLLFDDAVKTPATPIPEVFTPNSP